MKIQYLLLILVGLASCSTDGAPTQPIAAVASASLPVVSVNSPEKTVREYLHWYSTQHDKLPTNFIATTSVSSKDTTGYYAVDFRVTENWLAAVRQSGVFSNTYLQYWRTYFRQYADTLRLHRQNEGLATGFEYDFLMLSQEADTRATELQAGTLATKMVGPNRAIVAALGPRHEGWREGLTFSLSQAATGKWLIDAIKVPASLTQ